MQNRGKGRRGVGCARAAKCVRVGKRVWVCVVCGGCGGARNRSMAQAVKAIMRGARV